MKVAADRVLTADGRRLTATCVEVVDGLVVAITPLSAFRVEPAATPYYSGLLVGESADGRSVLDVHIGGLYVGYRGRLLLFEGLDFRTLEAVGDTTYQVILEVV